MQGTEKKVWRIIHLTVRFVIALVILGIISVIIPALPGIREIYIPGPLTALKIARAIVSAVIVGVILSYGVGIRSPIREAIPKFPEAGEIGRNIVFLIAVAVAYESFRDIVYPYMYDIMWVYFLPFLLLGILLLIFIARDLLTNIDKLIAALTAPFTESKCPKCGEPVKEGVEFCSNCGAELTPKVQKKPTNCPTCGASLEEGAQFCSKCGTKIEKLET